MKTKPSKHILSGGQRSQACGGDDQVDHEDLPLHSGRLRHQHRHRGRRRRASWKEPADPRDQVHRCERQGLQHDPAFYYGYTLDSPGMIMRLPRVGSQYLMGFLDAEGNP